jgi:hypothetical protein
MALFSNDPSKPREAMVAAMRLNQAVEGVIGYLTAMSKAGKK